MLNRPRSALDVSAMAAADIRRAKWAPSGMHEPCHKVIVDAARDVPSAVIGGTMANAGWMIFGDAIFYTYYCQ